MFMNVITGYVSTFIVIQCHIFVSKSFQGQTNSTKCVFSYIPTIDIPNIEISLERTKLMVSSLGDIWVVKKQ